MFKEVSHMLSEDLDDPLLVLWIFDSLSRLLSNAIENKEKPSYAGLISVIYRFNEDLI